VLKTDVRGRPGRGERAWKFMCLHAFFAVTLLFLTNVSPSLAGGRLRLCGRSTIIKTYIICSPGNLCVPGWSPKGSRENNGVDIKNCLARARVLLFDNDGAIIPPQPVRSIIKITHTHTHTRNSLTTTFVFPPIIHK